MFKKKKKKKNEQWKLKAEAFVVRCVHQLWGKRSEDMLVWLFKTGFKNSFIKDSMIGWSKKKSLRNASVWGIECEKDELIEIPPGIVFPYISEKNLLKVAVILIDEEPVKSVFLKGSIKEPLFLGSGSSFLILTDNIIDGFLLYQEAGDRTDVCVIDFSYDNLNENFFNKLQKWENIKYIQYVSTDESRKMEELSARIQKAGKIYIKDKDLVSLFEKESDLNAFLDENL